MQPETLDALKRLLLGNDPAFWGELATATRGAGNFTDLINLATLRKRAISRGLKPTESPFSLKPLRVALMGGVSLYPIQDLLEQALFARGFAVELWAGKYDNYVSEILDPPADLVAFKPELAVVIPAPRQARLEAPLHAPRAAVQTQIEARADELLGLCRQLRERTGAEVILTNFVPTPQHDPGPYRARSAASGWTSCRLLNAELGQRAPAFVHLCDADFLASRIGLLQAVDPRSWFESKQLGSPALLVELAHEIALSAESIRKGPKKVLVLDMDNTLYGGVIGDDGLEGIELGDTSPRGEAFKAFQAAILELGKRGILLAISSKNDEARALEVIEKHPEMVLRKEHFVSIKANWQPKSDNIRIIAQELNLGLDSFVFVDDNPAEIEIVRQFVPQVSTIHLGADPSLYVAQLLDARHFEPSAITAEDLERTSQYQAEARRNETLASATDMPTYLKSLEMVGTVSRFRDVDVPRISQLINKSNQFNLTTRRRSEAEVSAVVGDPTRAGFTMRLTDRFGDHGLISIVILEQVGDTLEVDTWVMSCRVLKRQVEEEIVNEIFTVARARSCRRVLGKYLPTAKNGMVSELYPKFGFASVSGAPAGEFHYERAVGDFAPYPTFISIEKPV